MKRLPILLFFFSLLISCEVSINKDHVAEGTALLSSGDISNALLEFDDALFIDNSNTQALRGKYFCYLQMGDLDKALEQANKFIEIKSDAAVGYSDRGIIYLSKKEYNKALEDFNRVIEIDTTYPLIAYFNKGEALRELNRFQEAVRCYDIVTKKDTSDARAFFKKGLAYAKLGYIDSSCLSYQKAMTLGEKDAETEFRKVCK